MFRVIGKITVGFWLVVIAIALLIGGWALYLNATGNIATIVDGVAYRSATLSPERLGDLIADKKIRSVLTLRGGEGLDWYDAQKTFLADRGITFAAIPISATEVPSEETLMHLAFELADLPKPILIHCKAGADRAGLASAIYRLVVEGVPKDEARRMLSFAYGHFPWFGSETRAMDLAFDRFASDWSAYQMRIARWEEAEGFKPAFVKLAETASSQRARVKDGLDRRSAELLRVDVAYASTARAASASQRPRITIVPRQAR
ncbi:tyrosine-protein phosphatase [Fulvimarina sp. 2208YS6-2-32]|uniref:Tyrosine-protein phosphatase n=1 Tax=Fulvimarina uroteuthidis TaxID=3098149 RepID=A0ABU5I3D5_9HYPH|nr:tyrosine-protein phosphatase [Fulvimarina sp. 2208YS6-2-32]MDY8109721.1 tyrosine-protein phosphatase [Fulvimarina sp. 2208YS6-2-32]